jgi:hypothetical protein
MSRKSTFAALAIFAAASSSAFANDITLGYADPTPAATSRAAVQADLREFKQSGVNPWSNQYNPLRHADFERSRAQVGNEYLSARERVAAFTAEDSGSAYLAASSASPAPVHVAGQPRNAQ